MLIDYATDNSATLLHLLVVTDITCRLGIIAKTKHTDWCYDDNSAMLQIVLKICTKSNLIKQFSVEYWQCIAKCQKSLQCLQF